MNSVHKTVLAGSVMLAFGGFAIGPASASGSNSGPPNVDPYTYDYSVSNQGARADVGAMLDQGSVGAMQQAIYDRHGHVIGFAELESAAN
jgi:hypothetical protein